MSVCDIDDPKKISCLMADPEGLGFVVKEFTGMFDREVFDCIIASGRYGHVIAGIMASKLGKGVVCVNDGCNFCSKALKSGWKVVVMCDLFDDGKKTFELVQKLESLGCTVIRIGFIIEDTRCGGRKSKILKKYPFEAAITI